MFLAWLLARRLMLRFLGFSSRKVVRGVVARIIETPVLPRRFKVHHPRSFNPTASRTEAL